MSLTLFGLQVFPGSRVILVVLVKQLSDLRRRGTLSKLVLPSRFSCVRWLKSPRDGAKVFSSVAANCESSVKNFSSLSLPIFFAASIRIFEFVCVSKGINNSPLNPAGNLPRLSSRKQKCCFIACRCKGILEKWRTYFYFFMFNRGFG